MRLLEPFSYKDNRNVEWAVPQGTQINGASIPTALWTIVGHPFKTPYRSASVVHDWYCDVRTRHWRDVHRMFFEAMLDSGVNRARAQMMYVGVLAGGPRWDEQAIANNRLVLQRRHAERKISWDNYWRAKDQYDIEIQAFRTAKAEGRTAGPEPTPPTLPPPEASMGAWTPRDPEMMPEEVASPFMDRSKLEPVILKAGKTHLSLEKLQELAETGSLR